MRNFILWIFIFLGWFEMYSQTWIFDYVGNSPQTFVVPQGVCRIKIIAKGAGGGGGTCGGCHFQGGYGGSGGYVEGIFTVNAGDVLSIYVGQGGTAGQASSSGNCCFGPGGWGYTNGGNGGNSTPTPFPGRDAGGGGGGGGSSAVLINGTLAILAGGGGGAGGGSSCGSSGGAPGGNGGDGGGSNGGGQAGYEGIAGAAPTGNGTNGMNGINYSSGAGGGGGGYLGGTGGQVPPCGENGGGGGGSSYCAGSSCVINIGGGGAGGSEYADGQNGQITIINISPPLNLSITSQSISCYGYNDGCATAIPSGGNPPFTYTWSNGATVSVNCGLSHGTYTATVIDMYGCKASNTVNIIEPSPIIPSITTASVSCYDFSDGSATVTATGGTGNYNYYEFQPYGGAGSNNTAYFLHAGTYTAYVYDGNNCVGTQTFQIIQPPPINASYITHSVTCYNGTDGSATVTASGGVGGFSYVWTPNVSSSYTISNVPYNTYTCQVIDANGCTKELHIPINQPQQITIQFNVTPDRCYQNNGIAYSIVHGGVQPYSYQWSTGATNTPSVSGLTGNQTYTLTIIDANNCVYQDTVYIPSPPPPQITTTSFTPPLCHGGKDGIASVSYTYGTPPIYIQWQPGGVSNSIVQGISAGNYTISVMDYYGCMTSTIITVSEPPAIGLNVSPYQVICYGTTATLNASAYNGTPPYQYFWDANSGLSGAGPHTVTLTATTSYSVYAQDNNGCKSNQAVVIITVKPPLLAKGEAKWLCAEEHYILTPLITGPGNNGPYNYLWSNGVTTYSNEIVADINNNPATYTLNISDGCSIPDAVAIYTINVSPKSRGTFNADIKEGCPPLKVTFNAWSSDALDTYYWNFGNGNSTMGNEVISIYEGVGFYPVSIEITNKYGCKWDTTIVDYIKVYPKPIADFEPYPSVTTIDNPLINFLNLSQDANSYEWNFGDLQSLNNTSNEINPYHVYELAGEYQVYLTAKNTYGCMDVTMKKIKIDPVYALYIPNVFTPNGDGLNDIFQPKGVGIDVNNYRMLIYDRWGELVYESNNFNVGWDGAIKGNKNKATQDVYVYKIYTQDLKGNKYEYVGHVTCLPNHDK